MKGNDMHASPLGSKHRVGAIGVAPETDEIVALSLKGEFDMANARDLGDQIDRTLEGGKNLILDLSEVTFIDSSVIHVLVQASEAAGAREQAIVLQLGGTAHVVERALEITRTEQVLPRAYERQEAVRITQQQVGL